MFYQVFGKKVANYFEMAATFAAKKDGRTFFHGAIGIRADGVLVRAVNGRSDLPNRMVHAEYRLCKKLTKHSIVYVCRISNGSFALSRPCMSCQKVMKATGVKKCFYSIGPSEYGIMEF